MLLYSKGPSTRDIQSIFKDIYGIELSPSTISGLTDRIIPEIKEWLSRPLEPVYAFLFIDCTFVKVRLEGRWEGKYPQVVREWEMDREVITTFYRAVSQ